MPPARHTLALFAAILAAAVPPAAPAEAQAPTAGLEVTVTARREPLRHALVYVDGARAGITDSAGVATLGGLAPGRPRAVEVRHPGYRPHRVDVRLAAGEVMRLEVELAEAPVELPGVDATVRWVRSGAVEEALRRIERDRAAGLGPDEIALYGGSSTGRLLGQIPAFRALLARSGGFDSVRGPPTCRFAFWVDGVFDPHLGNTTGVGFLGDLDALYPPQVLEAVEVYPIAQVPARFGGSRSACGVVLLWTVDTRPDPPLITRIPKLPALPEKPVPDARVAGPP